VGNQGAEIKRYYGSRPQNTEYYFNESLTYTVAKRSGRRFGYLHESSIFGHKGSVLVPDRAIWNALSYTNSHLFTYLMLTQTSERMWEVGFVQRSRGERNSKLLTNSRHSHKKRSGISSQKASVRLRLTPYDDGPILLDVLGVDDPLPQYDHPTVNYERLIVNEPESTASANSSLTDIGTAAAKTPRTDRGRSPILCRRNR